MKENIIEIIKTIIDDEYLEKLHGDFNLIEDLEFDSLQIINFLLSIQEDLNIEIDFDHFDFEILESINNLCLFLEKE